MKLSVKEITVFGMLGALMYASKIIMDMLPNIHLLGVFVIALTVVYRKKALYPIYTFVLITGLMAGFATWWIPYLYIWTILWAWTMLLTRRRTTTIRPIVYMMLCAAHGFLFSFLYAPVQALLFGLDYKGIVAWVLAGLSWDFTHGVSNFFCGTLICPLISLLENAERYSKGKYLSN